METKESTMPASMRYPYEQLLATYNFETEFITLRQNNSKPERHYLNCLQALPKLACASHIFLSDACELTSCLPLRSETRVFQMWHASGAFKKWGLSTAEKEFGEPRRRQLAYPTYKNLSLVCTSSEKVRWAYEEAMGLKGTGIVQAIGNPATDIFFDEGFIKRARYQLERAIPQAAGKQVILYAPTFRGHVVDAGGPNFLDIEQLQAHLHQDSVLVVRHHPFVKHPPAIPGTCREFAFDVSADKALSIDVLLCAADVLVTDYSSVVFDYSLLVRPVCFFAPDKDEYLDWRGFYYSLEELDVGPVFSETNELASYLEGLSTTFDGTRIERFCACFMDACDGAATKRLFDFAFGEQLENHLRPRAAEALPAQAPDAIDISIVVPAYNASATLGRCLSAIQAQNYPHSRMEVLVVDDGSTDATREIAQSFAEAEPALFNLIELGTCSGSPAHPRNVGLEAARGTYVFFHDADDWLEATAVNRMLDSATNWQSDILLVKMFDEDRRGAPKSAFVYSQPAADIYTSNVLWTFAPIKLFRRSLIQDLRFPAYMPEDIPFVLRAYVAATTVSVAADGFYYHATLEGEAGHASTSTWDNIDSNLAAYTDIFSFIEHNVPVKARNKVLMKRLFWRDIYHTFLAIAREADTNPARAQQHFEALRAITQPYWQEPVYKTCKQPVRQVLETALEPGTSLGTLQTVIQKAGVNINATTPLSQIQTAAQSATMLHDANIKAS